MPPPFFSIYELNLISILEWWVETPAEGINFVEIGQAHDRTLSLKLDQVRG